MTRIRCSRHAKQRWRERVARDHRLSDGRTVRAMLESHATSIAVTYRYVQRCFPFGRTNKLGKHRKGATFRVSTLAVFVMRGDTIVTVLPWSMDQMAVLLVHNMLGQWVEPDEDPWLQARQVA